MRQETELPSNSAGAFAFNEKEPSLAEAETVLQLAREVVAAKKTADLKWREDEESEQYDETELVRAGGPPVKFKVSWEGEMRRFSCSCTLEALTATSCSRSGLSSVDGLCFQYRQDQENIYVTSNIELHEAVSVLPADSETELRMTIATTTGPANKRKRDGLANSVLSFDDVRVAMHEIEKQGSSGTGSSPTAGADPTKQHLKQLLMAADTFNEEALPRALAGGSPVAAAAFTSSDEADLGSPRLFVDSDESDVLVITQTGKEHAVFAQTDICALEEVDCSAIVRTKPHFTTQQSSVKGATELLMTLEKAMSEAHAQVIRESQQDAHEKACNTYSCPKGKAPSKDGGGRNGKTEKQGRSGGGGKGASRSGEGRGCSSLPSHCAQCDGADLSGQCDECGMLCVQCALAHSRMKCFLNHKLHQLSAALTDTRAESCPADLSGESNSPASTNTTDRRDTWHWRWSSNPHHKGKKKTSKEQTACRQQECPQTCSIGRGDGSTYATKLNRPRSVAVSHDALVYVCDVNEASKVHVYDAKNGSFVRSIGADFGAGPGGLDTPMAVLVNDQHVFVSDYTCHRVQVFRASDGKFVRSLGEGELQNPSGLALDAQGNLYVADTSNNTIRIFHCKAE